jgi:maltoporin
VSIFNFTKDDANNVILKPKEKTIKMKYKLFQYNLTIKNYVRIDKTTTFTEITKYLEKQDIHINLKT